MSAKLIFVVMTTVVAIGSAVMAGIITALAGLSAKVPTATLITLITGSAAAGFGGVIALSGMAASILFNTPDPARQITAAISPAKRRRTRSIQTAENGQPGDDTACDQELRRALQARMLLLHEERCALRKH